MTDKKPEFDPSERVSSMYTLFDERSFCFYTRKLSEDPHFWPSADQLMKALVANSKEPFPALLEQHLRQRLDGTAKKRRGRKKNWPFVEPKTAPDADLLQTIFGVASNPRAQAGPRRMAAYPGSTLVAGTAT